MKLYSHGETSDLREHLAEVMTAAETPEERILCACHDLGKATVAWQKYIRGVRTESPHHHAAAGGIFAALLLLELNGPDAPAWALAALHAGAAHHTYLQELGSDFLGDLSLIAVDPQVREFVLDREYGIASLLPEVPDTSLVSAWESFVRLAPPVSPKRMELNRALKAALSPELRLKAYLHSRSLLGRLCLQDHRSAARQSGKSVEVREWQSAFPEKAFSPRPARHFTVQDSPLALLRTRMHEAFLSEVAEQDATFYFIDAPTGLGKTEAMLRGAELLRERGDFRRIVFAVPQVSVADQVYEDYFSGCAAAQIWNFRRREKTGEPASPEPRSGNGVDAQALEIEQHPFEEPYNVTTFNQVLLAMCHPDRNRCIRGLGLRDAVVILDEFHKLPQVILPFFFRIAREYAEQFHCRFILGSATPLKPLAFWDLEDLGRIPEEVTAPVYRAPEIDNRRRYRSLGNLTVTGLGERIEAFQSESDRNLLVVVNLVGAGSWPLRQYFNQEFQPWRQLETLKTPGSGRIMVWLDGLVPPLLRRELIIACREAMQRRPVTLISTQMIEVGVDLDFDAALVDYQGLAATIQRGGRVGREGRSQPCEVEVFALVNDDGESSFAQLISVREKNDSRLKTSPFNMIYEAEKKFLSEEQRFFRNWNDRAYRDSELAESLSGFQQEVFSRMSVDRIYDRFFSIDMVSPQHLGAKFENAQFVAELFDSENAEPIVLVESQSYYEELCRLNGLVEKQLSSPEDRQKFLKLLIDRTITPSRKVLPELGLNYCGRIDYPDRLDVYRIDSLIL